MNDFLTPRQYAAIGFVCLLYPLLRRMPASAVAVAGCGAWLSCLLAVPVLAVLLLLYRKILRSFPGCGLGEVFLRVLGPVAGKGMVAVYAAWFLFVCAFILRSGAERFAATIYPNASVGVFLLSMLPVCALAACGKLKALGRCAMLFRPVLLATLCFVFAALLPRIQLTGLWQVTGKGIFSAVKAVPQVVNPLCVCLFMPFLSGATREEKRLGKVLPWLLCAVGIALLLTLCTPGCLGPELTVKLNHTFFIPVRDISLFGSEARVEALVITMWVFSDFLLETVMLRISLNLLGLLFPLPAESRKSRVMLLLPCLALILPLSFLMAKGSLALRPIAEDFVPLTDGILQLLPPLILLPVMAIRKRRRSTPS